MEGRQQGHLEFARPAFHHPDRIDERGGDGATDRLRESGYAAACPRGREAQRDFGTAFDRRGARPADTPTPHGESAASRDWWRGRAVPGAVGSNAAGCIDLWRFSVCARRRQRGRSNSGIRGRDYARLGRAVRGQRPPADHLNSRLECVIFTGREKNRPLSGRSSSAGEAALGSQANEPITTTAGLAATTDKTRDIPRSASCSPVKTTS